MSAKDVQFYFTMREQLKLFHWQTKNFSSHKATDAVIDAIDASIDKYVEVYMGSKGRMKVSGATSTIHIQNLSKTSIVKFVKKCIVYLQTELVKNLKETDTDLLNIRDEILAELNQLLYLFTLH